LSSPDLFSAAKISLFPHTIPAAGLDFRSSPNCNAKTGWKKYQLAREPNAPTDSAARESNRAFVLMQYYGYLRRDANDSPDADFSGYNLRKTRGGLFFRAATLGSKF
jgi:hypothetical protein